VISKALNHKVTFLDEVSNGMVPISRMHAIKSRKYHNSKEWWELRAHRDEAKQNRVA